MASTSATIESVEEESLETNSVKHGIIGALFALLSVTFWTLGMVSVQALQRTIPDFELNVIRLAGRKLD